MYHLTTNDPTNCLRVGRMFISRHPQRLPPFTVDQTAQETSSCMLISMFAQHLIEQVFFSIYGTTKISPAATDLDVGLVQIPGTTCHTTTFRTKVVTNQWCKPELPNPYHFVANFKASLQKKLCSVEESELVSQSPENSHQHDVVREWRSLNGVPERSL
jgi:hypothetical protein